jgi:hypothetical protein
VADWRSKHYAVVSTFRKMQTLWRKTSELFWQHPVLWLPILIAAILQFLLLKIQQLMSQKIVAFFAEGARSVLGGPAEPSSDPYHAMMKAGLFAVPLSIGIYLLNICLYVTALLVVARLVQASLAGDALNLRSAIGGTIQTCRRSVLGISLKILAAFVFGFLLFVQVFQRFTPSTTISGRNVGYTFAIILSVIAGYILTPAVMRILLSFRPISATDLSRARWTVILGVVVSIVIGLFAQRAELSFFTASTYPSALQQWLMQIVGELFTALPYVPLSIALSLIAFGQHTLPSDSELHDS